MLNLVRLNSLTRDFATLAGGTAIAQALGVALAPLITRIYSTEAIGVHGVFASLLAIVGVASTAAYSLAVVLPDRDEDAVRIGLVSVLATLLVSAVTASGLFLLGPWVSSALGLRQVPALWLLLSLAVFFTGLSHTASAWLLRTRSFHALSAIGIGNALGGSALKIGAGFINPSALTLIVAHLVTAGLQAVALCVHARRRMPKRNHHTHRHLLSEARRFSDFPRYRAPQDFINALGRSLPTILIAATAGPIPAGLYTLAVMALGAPTNLIGKSASDALYPRLAQSVSSAKSCAPLLTKATIALGVSGIVPLVFVVSLGPWAFEAVFGQGWGPSGEYARWLAPLYYFTLISRPAVAAVSPLRLQRGLLVYELGSTTAKLAALLAGFYVFNTDVAAIATFSAVGIFSYATLMIWVHRSASSSSNDPTSDQKVNAP